MPVLNDRDIHHSSRGVAPLLQNLICINFRDARGMQARETQDTDQQQLVTPAFLRHASWQGTSYSEAPWGLICFTLTNCKLYEASSESENPDSRMTFS